MLFSVKREEISCVCVCLCVPVHECVRVCVCSSLRWPTFSFPNQLCLLCAQMWSGCLEYSLCRCDLYNTLLYIPHIYICRDPNSLFFSYASVKISKDESTQRGITKEYFLVDGLFSVPATACSKAVSCLVRLNGLIHKYSTRKEFV